MSNSEGQSPNNQQESAEVYYIPRKFVFEVSDNNNSSQKEEAQTKNLLKKNIEAEKHLPFIFNFPEPANYKESYSTLIRQVIGAYNYVRSLIIEDYYDQLRDEIEALKIEQPGDCLAMLKELLTICCEKLQPVSKDSGETRLSHPPKDYEELIQNAEAKIRLLIRNEQIFRLNFDILTQKCEDADKAINSLNQELENSKKAQEKLSKENAELVCKIVQKDDEIQKAQKERDSVEKRLREAAANLNAIDHLDQTMGRDAKHSAPGWNQQLLNVLMKENKYTSSETSTRPPSNLEAKTLHAVRQHSNRMTPTDKLRAEKANTNGGSTSSSNLTKAQVEKMRNSLVAEFKRHMNSNLASNQNKTGLNASLDVMLNKSTEQSHSQERVSVSGAMLSAKKRSSQQMKVGQSQDQIRMKPPAKERKIGESGERDHSPYLTNQAVLQKIMNNGNKPINVRPTSSGRLRESPLMSRSRIVQTEQSPDSRSQESKILYTYASNQSTDLTSGAYYGNSKKRPVEPRDSRGQSRGSGKTSVLIKNMIADHMNKKIGPKAV